MRWLTYILFFSFLIHGTREKLYGQTTLIQNLQKSKKSVKFRYSKVADSLFNLGLKLQATQSYQESLSSFKSSLKLYEFIGDNEKEGECFSKIAASYYYLGDYSKAITSFKISAGLFKKIGYKKGLASSLNNIGGVYNSLGKYLRSLDLLSTSYRYI